jgi:hypothetical protein
VETGIVSPIDVDPAVYDAASKVFGQTITGHLTHAFTNLQRALGSTGAMAGTDPGGTTWAASYDHAATATFDAMTEANDACFTLAAMLEMTGFNHGMAENHSNPSGHAPTPPDITTYTAPGEFMCYARPPSAAGGSGSPPHGWGLIQHLVGCVWPNGHQNKLHKAAHAWSSAAHRLDTAARFVPEAVHAVRSQRSPEVDDAVTVCQAMAQHIQDISSSCRSLATACSDFAHYIDKAHRDMEQELVELLEWTAAIETGGALLGVVSFGAAEIPAQAAETGRIAATATRVHSIIARLTYMASTSETASNVMTKLAPIAQWRAPASVDSHRSGTMVYEEKYGSGIDTPEVYRRV